VTTANSGDTFDASVADVSYEIAAGTYAFTVDGFGPGDVLDFFGAAVGSVSLLGSSQTDGSDGMFSVQGSFSGNIVTVNFTGVDPALDAQIISIGVFDSVFGAGTILA
jgi:hypothetical protein